MAIHTTKLSQPYYCKSLLKLTLLVHLYVSRELQTSVRVKFKNKVTIMMLC